MRIAKSSGEKIGFKLVENSLELVLPSFIKEKELNEREKVKEKVKYLRLFRKYRKYSQESAEQDLNRIKNNVNEGYMHSIFEAYYQLLLDYRQLGVFVFTNVELSKKQSGKISWNRTINKSSLIISENNLIYDNPYYKNRNILYNHPLTVLYGIYLLDIEELIGIKLNINNHYRKIIKNKRKNINKKSILEKYRYKMYRDRDRKIYSILEILSGENRKSSKIPSWENLHYLQNINSLWEHMLKKVLEDDYYDFNEYFPKGRYRLELEGKDYVKAGLGIIPDIIKEYKGKLYILDAKNYLPHINQNMPASADINKQILYRYFLSKEFNKENKYKLKEIKSIFLLPNDLEGKTIEKIGSHKFENLENSIGDIYIYQVDYDSILDAYIYRDNSLKEEILNKIEESSKVEEDS